MSDVALTTLHRKMSCMSSSKNIPSRSSSGILTISLWLRMYDYVIGGDMTTTLALLLPGTLEYSFSLALSNNHSFYKFLSASDYTNLKIRN